MARLLHIEASPRKERATSINVAKTFTDTYAETHPDDEVRTWDLWSEPLPEFNGQALNAKYEIMRGGSPTSDQQAAWQEILDAFARFDSGDKFLISLPMWNFGIPYKLKHLIDIVVQPGLAFNYDKGKGYTGLITGKPAVLIYARGGAYSAPEMQHLDFQRPYMETILGFMGITELHAIVVEPTSGPPEEVDVAKAEAIAQARVLARSF